MLEFWLISAASDLHRLACQSGVWKKNSSGFDIEVRRLGLAASIQADSFWCPISNGGQRYYLFNDKVIMPTFIYWYSNGCFVQTDLTGNVMSTGACSTFQFPCTAGTASSSLLWAK